MKKQLKFSFQPSVVKVQIHRGNIVLTVEYYKTVLNVFSESFNTFAPTHEFIALAKMHVFEAMPSRTMDYVSTLYKIQVYINILMPMYCKKKWSWTQIQLFVNMKQINENIVAICMCYDKNLRFHFILYCFWERRMFTLIRNFAFFVMRYFFFLVFSSTVQWGDVVSMLYVS